MSGIIKLKVRKGNSKDKRYKYYPEAYLEIIGEDNKKINISPSYNDLINVLIDFRKHELKVDRTRKRKNYTSKLINSLEQGLIQLKEVKLNEFDEIEDIYIQEEVNNNEKKN